MPMGFTLDDLVKGRGHNPLIRNILKTVTETFDRRRQIRPWMIPRGQNSRSYSDVKYVKNGKNCDDGPMGFTLNDFGQGHKWAGDVWIYASPDNWRRLVVIIVAH